MGALICQKSEIAAKLAVFHQNKNFDNKVFNTILLRKHNPETKKPKQITGHVN